MKKCAYCNKEIQESVLKCPFCGVLIAGAVQKKARWYHNKSSILIGFLIVGPFVLPAVWSHPEYSKNKKIVVTSVILFISALLLFAFVGVNRALSEFMLNPLGE